jgi:ABC-2 type transport system permease protein
MFSFTWRAAQNVKQINMKQLYIFVRKEFYHVFRDRKTLLLLFGMPLVQVLLFGFALTNEVKNAKVLICDQARDAASQNIIGMLRANPSFEVVAIGSNKSIVAPAFRKAEVGLAIVLPPRLQYDLQHGGMATIQVIADGSDPNRATTLSSYAVNVISRYHPDPTPFAGSAPVINTEIRMVYNPELKGVYNYVPGVIALVLLLVCVLMTSISIVKEKESGTMEILLVSPLNPFLVIIAKAIPYFVLSLLNLTLILILSVTLMEMPMQGNLLLLYFESALMILTALSLGLLISNVTASQQAAMLISLMGMLLPTMLFSGFMFPLENMPLPLQIIANVVPSKWYYIIVRNIMIKGLGFSGVWKETMVLAFMAIVLLVLSIKKFKIRLN